MSSELRPNPTIIRDVTASGTRIFAVWNVTNWNECVWSPPHRPNPAVVRS